jgi:outer membrane protein OmpA-like peptidoglycan-associated protein
MSEDSSTGPVQLTKKQADEAQQFYQEGLKHYLKRDYQRASSEWQKALAIDRENAKIKDYLDKAHQKYLESLNLFFKGIELFRKKDYSGAEQNFKDALLINPLDGRTKRYLTLCIAPNFQMNVKKKFFTPGAQDNMFFLSVDKSQSAQDWIGKWEVVILDPKRQVVRTLTGTGDCPPEVAWDLKDARGALYTGEKARYALRLISIYDRVVSSMTNDLAVDALGPSVKVTANSNFTPDDIKGKAVNKVTFNLNVSDPLAGVSSVRVDIYKPDKTTLIASLPAQPSGQVVWDGTKSDGTKVAGGDTVYYSVVAVDQVSNISRTDPAKIEAAIYIDESFRMNLPNIEFELGRAELLPSSFNILNKVGDILGRFPNAKFVIEGHTDNRGADDLNLRLSRQRAESVYSYLKKNFKLSADRVVIQGYGASKPVAPNDTEENQRKNRRVEIQIVNED